MYLKHFIITLLLLLFYTSIPAQTKREVYIDSLVAELASHSDDTNKGNILDKLSFTFSKVDPNEGIKYATQLHTLSKKLKWKAGMAKANAVLGINYAAKSEHTKALAYYNEALKISQEIGDRSKMAGNMANICLIYLSQGNYPRALSTGFDALRIYEALNDVRNSAILQENIGIIYYEQKEHAKAMQYYSAALRGYQKINDTESIGRCYGNIGSVLGETGELEKALKNHQMALETNKQAGNKYSVQINLANIGIIYYRMEDYDAALENHFAALKISKEMGDKHSTAVNLGNLGAAYMGMAKSGASKNENLRKAIDYYEQAIALCKELNFAGPYIEFTEGLSESYTMAGNYQRAFDVFKDHVKMKDSLFSIQSKLEIAELEMKRKEELKNKDLQISKNKKDISRLESIQARSKMLVYLACAFAISLLILFILKNLFAYRRSARILSREKELHLTHIKTQKDLLEEIAHLQAHDVSGPVATILGLTKVFNYDNPADPTNQTVMKGITEVTEVLDEKVKEVIKKKNEMMKL